MDLSFANYPESHGSVSDPRKIPLCIIFFGYTKKYASHRSVTYMISLSLVFKVRRLYSGGSKHTEVDTCKLHSDKEHIVIVLTTNVAETNVIFPNLDIVFDFARENIRFRNMLNWFL